MKADLHLHTTASDGLLTPTQMVQAAREAGMDVIAISDHDTPAGLQEALLAGQREGICVLPALELSVGGDEEIHILAYGIDPDNATLRALLDSLMVERRERMLEMLRRLDALGMPVPLEETGAADSPFMGRMNLARAMVARGYCATLPEAFSRWLSVGKPIHVPRRRIGVREGARLLREMGAVPVLAHPGRLPMDESNWLARLPGWIDAGLEGIEAYHSSHPDPFHYDRIARQYGLLVTGGSDSHGRKGERAWIGEATRAWYTAQADVEALQARMTKAGR